ncbi:MAG TPA: hypothetical protein PKE08_00095 [Candidatus Paceibacterota bacterium]|nr:hypothetical protein [Candidatus Paceibacterota bacterium]
MVLPHDCLRHGGRDPVWMGWPASVLASKPVLLVVFLAPLYNNSSRLCSREECYRTKDPKLKNTISSSFLSLSAE